MQPCSPAGCPSCQEAEQEEQNSRQALPEQCAVATLHPAEPLLPVSKLQGRKEKLPRYNGQMLRAKEEQPAAQPSLSKYLPCHLNILAFSMGFSQC